MKKQIISIKSLLAFLLAAPCLNAGLDSWISSILPERMRASESMRSSIYTATKHLKMKKPVFVMHASLEENTLAEAENYLPFSIIKVDNDAIARQSDTDQKYVGYHEVGHVVHNHAIIDSTAKQIAMPSYILGAVTACQGVLGRHSLTPSRRSALLVTSAISWICNILAERHVPDYSAPTSRKYELEADTTAFSLTAALDGNAPLEKRLAFLNKIAETKGLDYRDRSEAHPTAGEEIALIHAALAKKPA